MTSSGRGDNPDDGKPGRKTGISLFHPGQPVPRRPVTLDLRTGREIFGTPLSVPMINPARVWESLNPVTLDAETLAGNGLFTQPGTSPAGQAFDVLRTRLLQALATRGWRRIAVTSPTHGCGNSFVAANLALSLARRPSSRTVLMDLELRDPALAGILGVPDAGSLRDFLTGEQPLESLFRRVGRTLALGLNAEAVPDAAELLHEPDTARALAAMLEQLDPEVVIYDLPPVLTSDDVLAVLPQVDAVLLVADGTKTTVEDIKASERLFENKCPLMGVVLNRAQDRDLSRYIYGKR